MEEIMPIVMEIHELQSRGKSLLNAKTFLFITSRNDCNKSSKTESFTNEKLPRTICFLPENPMPAFKPTFYAKQNFSARVYSIFSTIVVFKTSSIPVPRTKTMTFYLENAPPTNCWLIPW